MSFDVEDYVIICHKCQVNKAQRLKVAGLLHVWTILITSGIVSLPRTQKTTWSHLGGFQEAHSWSMHGLSLLRVFTSVTFVSESQPIGSLAWKTSPSNS